MRAAKTIEPRGILQTDGLPAHRALGTPLTPGTLKPN